MKKIITIGIFLIISSNVIAQTYSPDKAAEYARFWCNKRNNNRNSPDYDQEKWGGPYFDHEPNCAAFVSQCLICGGLDLSAGTNGNGAYVKDDRVIAGVNELIQHLKKYQNTTYDDKTNYNVIADHDLGDPAFMGTATNFKNHSTICSTVDGNTKKYSAHSNDHCNDNLSSCGNAGWHYITSFHIKSSIPEHCDNCIQDGDETDVDCGGSCPPCVHAPDQRQFISTTSNLPSTVYAIENITAGTVGRPASVKVLSGQNVSFFTVGTIDLLHGFEVEAGADFEGQIKGKRLDATADCNAFCDPEIYNAVIYRMPGNTYVQEIINATQVNHVILQLDKHENYITCYSGIVNLTNEGLNTLWNLEDGEPRYDKTMYYREYGGYIEHQFLSIFNITACQGDIVGPYSAVLLVRTPTTRSIEVTDDDLPDTDSEAFLANINREDLMKMQEYAMNQEETTPVNEITVYPNPNNGSFTVITPNADEIKHIRVVNVLGQEIYSVLNPLHYTITLPAGAKGTYFVSITTQTEIVTKKIIVQ